MNIKLLDRKAVAEMYRFSLKSWKTWIDRQDGFPAPVQVDGFEMWDARDLMMWNLRYDLDCLKRNVEHTLARYQANIDQIAKLSE
ncbi:hypothetical protein [Brevundimonas sp. TWP2-3-4b1]|uniref:hypothetical protein n=1 Tax=Brevundimonas sp. TWP2-3-4b1 TaxID=2804580 RepID=UPI003CF6AD5F